MIELDDDLLLKGLGEGSHEAFAAIFLKYYRSLVLYCNSFITDMTECEDIVSSVFVELWEKRKILRISSLRTFLLCSVRNDCLDSIKHRKIVETYAARLLTSVNIDTAALDSYLLYDELDRYINNVLDSLDPKSVQAFKMSRWDGMKYDDIAKELNVSRRTVEVRVTNVIRLLRENLKKHFPTI